MPAGPSSLTLALHFRFVACTVHGEFVVPHDVLDKLRPQAESVVQLEQLVARYPSDAKRGRRPRRLVKRIVHKWHVGGAGESSLEVREILLPLPEWDFPSSV